MPKPKTILEFIKKQRKDHEDPIIEKALLATLKKKGYELIDRIKETFILKDPTSNQIIGVIISELNEKIPKIYTTHFKENSEIPLFKFDGSKYYEIKKTSESGRYLEIQLDDFYSFLELKTIVLKEAIKKNYDYFKLTSWVLAFLVSLILFINTFCIKLEIRPDQLILIGLIVFLILIPHVQKLKILGLEYEKNEKTKTP